MKIEKKIELGMELEVWVHKSCEAKFGVGDDWATLYWIQSSDPGKGHATELLKKAKKFYEEKGLDFGGTIALNDTMKKIYEELNIKEYL